MRLKTTLLTLIAAISLSAANAQDRIYTKSGAMYEVKIKEVGTKMIVYKKWNNLDGPDYVMPKADVERVKFQNGDEEQFSIRGRMHAARQSRETNTQYGKNIIGLSPIHMTNISPIGFGVSYEAVLDKRYILSFYLPIVYSFRSQNNTNYYSSYPEKNERKMLWFYPGAKIYPTGSDGVVRYAVGPSLAIGTGNRSFTVNNWDPATQTNYNTDVTEEVFAMGVMVNNSLNIHPTPRLHLGLELGIGVPYYTNESKNYGNYYYNSISDEPLIQFNFNVGYRF